MNHLWLSKEQLPQARKHSQKMSASTPEHLAHTIISKVKQLWFFWHGRHKFALTELQFHAAIPQHQPWLRGLEGIYLLLNIKGRSAFIVLLALSDLGTSYRHSMEFQMTLPYYPSLHFLGCITRKLDFWDVLNCYKQVIIGNVDWHGKALTVETGRTERVMHVKSTNTWKRSHK